MARIAWVAGAIMTVTIGCLAPTAGSQELDPKAIAEALSQAFSQAADTAKPAVANISTTTVIPGRRDPFGSLFGNFFGRGAFTTPDREVQSLGSGVVIRSDGYVVTNHHVVRGAQTIVVALGRGDEYEATVRGSDPASDLAVLKIDATDLPTASWGDSDALRIGEWVIAIGSPHGLRYSVTSGTVSAKGRRDVGIATFEDFIQTDASINPGNSGGALVNLQGEVVGIPTAIISKSGGYEGVGFAIPAKEAEEITNQLIENGLYERGWVGIIPGPLSRQRAELARIDDGAGLFVDRLYKNSPAHKAGIKPGDIIVSCNDLPVAGLSTVAQALEALGSRGELAIGYVRLERAGDSIRRAQGTTTISVVPQPVDSEGRALQGI